MFCLELSQDWFQIDLFQPDRVDLGISFQRPQITDTDDFRTMFLEQVGDLLQGNQRC